VTESISIPTAPRVRLAQLHFAALATCTYLSASLWVSPLSAQEEPEPAAEAEAEAAASAEAPADAAEDTTDAEAPTEDTSAEAGTTEATADGSSEAGGAVVAEGGSLFESSSAESATVSTGGEDGFSLDIGGYTRGDVFVGVIPGTGQVGINAAYGELSLQATAKKGTWGSAFADFRVRYGQQLSTKDLFLDLRESYVNAYFGPVDIRLGKQIVVWGRADAFNPTSNLTPVDFRIRSPMEDDRRVGNIGARMFINLLPVRIEAVWMPLYEPTVYPDIQMDNYVYFVEPTYPSLSVLKGTGAARVHLELPSFEASVSYLYGEALLPGIALSQLIAPGDDPNTPGVLEPGAVYLSRTSYNHHVIGADFSTAIGDLFGLRGEAAMRVPVNQTAKPWAAKRDLQWIVGIDKEFGDVMIIAQYLGRYTFNWEAKRDVNEDAGGTDALCCVDYDTAFAQVDAVLFNTNQMIFSQLHRLQSLASLRVEWKTLHEKLSISALGMVNFNTQEWMLMPKIGYQITGGLSAYLGGEIFQGPEGTLMGAIDETLSAGYAELRLTY